MPRAQSAGQQSIHDVMAVTRISKDTATATSPSRNWELGISQQGTTAALASYLAAAMRTATQPQFAPMPHAIVHEV